MTLSCSRVTAVCITIAMQRKKPIRADAVDRKRILDGWRDSNLSLQSYAESVGVALSTLHRWKRDVREGATQPPGFLELQVPGKTQTPDQEKWLELRLAGGLTARIGPLGDDAAKVFCSIVSRLGGVPC